MRKYLEEIGITGADICAPDTEHKDGNSPRLRAFMNEREIYGFDSRETWGLNFTSACWLYEHLRMYVDVAEKIVNLEFYKFTVSEVVVDEDRLFNLERLENMTDCVTLSAAKEITQMECINLCLKYLKDYIQTEERQEEAEHTYKDYKWSALAQEYIDQTEAQQAFRIYAEILPAMWW